MRGREAPKPAKMGLHNVFTTPRGVSPTRSPREEASVKEAAKELKAKGDILGKKLGGKMPKKVRKRNRTVFGAKKPPTRSAALPPKLRRRSNLCRFGSP